MQFALRIAVVACLAFLSGCDTSEERAEKHFARGVELLEAGDASRAIVEFRNTLALDDTHAEAHRLYARAARQARNIPDAYTNYIALSELRPNDEEAWLSLAELAILAQRWEEAERHARRLNEVEGEDEGRKAVDLSLRFHEAATDEDLPAVRSLVREAEALSDRLPANPLLERMRIEGYIFLGDFGDAISVTETAIDRGEASRFYYGILAGLYTTTGDLEKLEAHLRRMLQVFPEDLEAKQQLIALYIQDGRTESAEEFMRSEIEAAEDKVTAHVELIALIRHLRGEAAALDEIEAALEIHQGNSLLQALKAGVIFDRGQRAEAISLMQSIVDRAENANETDRFRVTLAKMLLADGNEVGARGLIEQVLDRDPGQVEALKMQAGWLIDDDKADAAIAALRISLDQKPDDAEAMTLMARAHERNGERQLAQDLLSLAVDASGNAPDESLRLANTLIRRERFRAAEEVLVKALRRRPGERRLLVTLGQVYVASEDWPRAEQVAEALRRIDVPEAKLAADELQLQVISQQQGRDQGLSYLQQLVDNSDAAEGEAARITLIQARLAANQGDEALLLAEELVRELPGSNRAALVLGNTQFALGRVEAAEQTFGAVLDKSPDNGLAAIQMVRVLGAQGRVDDARAVVETGLAASPSQPDLLWAKASFLERDNDIDGAIEIYERLYEMNTNSPVIANNLASLLATYREDQASLDRAYAVGRRLRGTEVPQFQDTYGWILYRRGEFAEALTYLEPSALALDGDPIVQYHLGKTYLALDRDEDALKAFSAALDVAGNSDQRPQIADAKSEVERLQGQDGQ